jgi:hypothetical protein
MKITFGSKMGRTFTRSASGKPQSAKPIEETLQKIKAHSYEQKESYRERSLAIHGLTCAKCAREFDAQNRRLLTVHHKDGNHDNNPPDGSNWENLCLYCHEAEHSRGALGDYLAGCGVRPESANKEKRVFFSDDEQGESTLAAQLKAALEKGGKNIRNL